VGPRRRRQGVKDGVHHSVEVFVYVLVSEAQGLEADSGEHSVTAEIMVGLVFEIMMSAIDLNDQSSAKTGEVWIVAEQGNLPTEVKAVCFQQAELPPEAHLLACHGLAEFSGTFD
jgi:hypothetical protein